MVITSVVFSRCFYSATHGIRVHEVRMFSFGYHGAVVHRTLLCKLFYLLRSGFVFYGLICLWKQSSLIIFHIQVLVLGKAVPLQWLCRA